MIPPAKPLTFCVTTSNITALPTRALGPVTARIAIASRFPGVNFGQELDPTRFTRVTARSYSSVWAAVMRKRSKVTVNNTVELPISIPKRWKITYSTVHRVHNSASSELHGKAHGISPARFISEARTMASDGTKCAWFNCHPVSKGHDPGASFFSWRQAKLNQYMDALSLLVNDAHREGYTCIYGGDMNDPTPRAVAVGQITIAHSGLDWLWVLPAAGYRVRITKRVRLPRTGLFDHPILHERFTLHRA